MSNGGELFIACKSMLENIEVISPDTIALFGCRHRCSPERIATALQIAVYVNFYCHLTNVNTSMPSHEFASKLSRADRMNSGRSSVWPAGSRAYIASRGVLVPPCNWLRFYFNVCPEGAIEVMGITTANLSKNHTAFRLKVLLDTSVRRSDAVVLYVPTVEWHTVMNLIRAVWETLQSKRFIRSKTPLFSKSIYAGIALAEDPGVGVSFGMHRSGLVARMLVKAYLQGLETTESKWLALCEEFASNDLSIAQPYLNAGSQDIYCF